MEFTNKDCYKGKPGVYKVLNKTTGEFYIGKTSDLYSRYMDHYRTLRDAYMPKKKGSKKLTQAGQKHSLNEFEFQIVARTPNFKIAGEIEAQLLAPSIKPIYNVAGAGMSHLENSSAKPVIQYGSNGLLIKIFASCSEAGREIGITGSAILKVVNKVDGYKSAGGYYWTSYVDEPPTLIEVPLAGSRQGSEMRKYWSSNKYSIKEWNLKGELLREFKNIEEAVTASNSHRSCFNAHLRGEYYSIHGKIYTLNDNQPKIHSNKRSQSVRRFDLEGNLIEIHQTVRQAAEQFNCDVSTIREAIRLKRGTNFAVGYIWAYDDNSTVTPIRLTKRKIS